MSVSVCELWLVFGCARVHVRVHAHTFSRPCKGWVPDTAVKGGTFSKNNFGSMMGGNGVSWEVPWVHCLSLSLVSVSRQSFSVSGVS